jgi:predicted alpha/beta hydrolase
MTEILAQDTVIPARDGYPLAATVFTPLERPRGTVLINSATAVPRKIYRGFATYLGERGFAALTYDYRGVAGSGQARSAPPAVDLLCSGFTGTTPQRVDIHPRDISVARIGHFGFYRSEFCDTLWREAVDWLSN